ncbi:LysM peptidoglycan-binding domain-containing protein [Cytophagaceae bacterium ABcell3]|nr:LysM peptidoglycan-binding domain-containing protein [Cytophagaceae bacterium ABcell3]
MSGGKLEKLTIKAYRDEKYNDPVEDGTFTTLLNPEKYVYSFKTEQNEDQAPGTSAVATKFNKILPQTLDLDFLFDRTGTIKGYESREDGVIGDIEKFKEVLNKYDGETHKPYYLLISWGVLLFKCQMKEMSIEFKLFKPDGTPIRALARTKMVGFVEQDLRAAMENRQSPDLTHHRIVREGDTLPLLTKEIYGDSKYYLEVAKFNGLVNFRRLETGTELIFPPLQKQK